MRLTRVIRNIAFATLLATAAFGIQRRVFAASCASISGGWDFVSLSGCGPYSGASSSAVSDMRGIAASYVTGYNWGSGVYSDPYWWARVGSFEDPAYYDSYWQVY